MTEERHRHAAWPSGGTGPLAWPDATGLSDTFDLAIEFSPGQRTDDPQYLSFEEALKDQLGLSLKRQKAPLKVMVLDHVERPAEN